MCHVSRATSDDVGDEDEVEVEAHLAVCSEWYPMSQETMGSPRCDISERLAQLPSSMKSAKPHRRPWRTGLIRSYYMSVKGGSYPLLPIFLLALFGWGAAACFVCPARRSGVKSASQPVSQSGLGL